MSSYSSVNTAQNVDLDYQLASMGSRIAAYLIDALIKFAYLMIIIGSFFAFGVITEGAGFLLFGFLTILMLPVVFYTLIFEVMNEGQTPGKRSQNIKVVSKDGASVSIGQYILRWVMRIVDFQLFSGLVALISIGASKYSQRIGDMVANTLVINSKIKSSLNQSSFVNLDEGYVPVYSSVTKLTDSDIHILKELLQDRSDKSSKLLNEAAEKIEHIIEVNKSGSSRTFLNTVVKDYNYFQRN